MGERVDEHTRKLSKQRAGSDEDVPRIPAENSAEVDADRAQHQGAEHEQPRVPRAGDASHDRLDEVEGHEPEQKTCGRGRSDQQTFEPEGLPRHVRQIPEVRDDVGRVWEEEQPEEAKGQQLDEPRAVPEPVVEEQCQPERYPGEEEVPEIRRVLERMRVRDPESDEARNQTRESGQRTEDGYSPVAK